MKTKICSDCVCWVYSHHIAGICYGICENEDSEFMGIMTQEGNSCSEFEEDETNEDDEENQ